jgi:membrane protein YdbS with pleckstrin-like domain
VPLPERILHEDEDVLVDTRPSWTALAGPGVLAVAVLAGCLAGLVGWPGAPAWFGWVLLGAFLLASGRFAVRLLAWRATSLAVTTSRVVLRSGVLRRRGREVPIESVQDVSFSQTLFERLARAGRVTCESAGERGGLPLVDVPRPEAFQAAVNRAITQARRAGRAGAPGAAGPVGAPALETIPDQIARLAELWRRGVLTDAEFTRKKAELLDRM